MFSGGGGGWGGSGGMMTVPGMGGNCEGGESGASKFVTGPPVVTVPKVGPRAAPGAKPTTPVLVPAGGGVGPSPDIGGETTATPAGLPEVMGRVGNTV